MSTIEKIGFPAAAGLLGILIGYGASSGGDPDEKVAQRLGALETQITEMQAPDEAIAGLEASLKKLGQGSETVAADVAKLAPALAAMDEKVGSLGTEIGAVKTEVAAVSTGLTAGLSEMKTAMAASTDQIAAITDKVATLSTTAPETAETIASTDADAATPAAAIETPADKMAKLVGEDGLILSIGQTGLVGDQKVFLSRLADGQAHVVLVGSGKATIGPYSGPVSLSGDCSLEFVGIEQRKAYLKPAC